MKEDILELDELKIKEAIQLIETLDYRHVTIKEIEEIIFPLFKGYTVSVPRYNPEVYLFRGRVCKKPIFVKELSYPPKEFVTKYGRANDIGQQLFYASIGRNIPFFETGAKVGDKLAMSIWRSKSHMLLNHVGFSKDTSQQLGSNRQLNNVYGFVEDMKNFGTLNEFVYNYLAGAYVKKISQSQEYLYKLTIAVTNKLLGGDLIDGVMYPTVEMYGNADNIALKPQFVDKNLEFVSVEFYEVTQIEGTKYSFDYLDSAVEFDENGGLLWTGKKLSWHLDNVNSQLTFIADGGEWFANNPENQRVNPIPIIEIKSDKSQSRISKQFNKGFENTLRITKEIGVQVNDESVKVISNLHLDFVNKTRFLSHYLPPNIYQKDICIALLNNTEQFLNLDEGELIEGREEQHSIITKNKDLTFNGMIYVYVDDDLTPEDSRFIQEHGKGLSLKVILHNNQE